MNSVRDLAVLLALVAGCQQDYDIVSAPDVNPGEVTECGFTPVPGTKMSVYDCNPVFTTTDEAWAGDVDSVGFHATPVSGHAFYQLWYSGNPAGQDFGDWGMGYAISGDGTNWEVQPVNPLLEAVNGAWDTSAMDAIQVVWDPDTYQYVLAYQGYNLDSNPSQWGLGLATSTDGVDWVRFPLNPVLDFTAEYDGVSYCWPLSLTLNPFGDGYIGYISGYPTSPYRNVCQVYPVYASSLDDWDPSTQPALEAGPEYYDASGIASAAVVEYDGRFYMFYSGFEDWVQGSGYQSSRYHTLNLATSEDGVTWVKHPDNPIPVHLTDDRLITSVAAQVVGTRIHLWLTDWYDELDTQAVGYYYYEPDIDEHP